MKHFTSKTQQIGFLGEQIAQNFLIHKGFSIIETNYTKKIGEIDIIATKGNELHFIEVKAIVSHETRSTQSNNNEKQQLRNSKEKGRVSRETTFDYEFYNPFENITPSKLGKLRRTIELYLLERHVSRETPCFIDAIAVFISREERSARVEVLWGIT